MYEIVSHWQVNDRAVAYGDGVFTTARVRNGQISLEFLHIERLNRDANAIGLPGPCDTVLEHARSTATKVGNGVLKIMLSAGVGGRGYARPLTLSPTATMQVSSVPAHYMDWQRNGIKLGISELRLGQQPLLSGIKHLNRLEQVLIKQRMSNDIDDVVVLDANERVIETSAANLFWLDSSGVWNTPKLNLCGVSGVMRAHLLKCLKAAATPVNESHFTLSDLAAAQSAIVCNSIMGAVPILSLQTAEFSVSYQALDVMPMLIRWSEQ